MKPRVSIILTTKNNEHIIERCLRSVAEQTYPYIELIVVDNFSIDQTLTIAQRFTKKTYSHGPERSAQRNYGFRHAQGDYLFFIDSDMELQRDTVQKCMHITKQGHGALIVDEQFIGRGYWSQCKALEKRCYTGTQDAEAARFVKKTLFLKIKGYDELLTGPEDLDLHKRLMPLTSLGRASGIIHHDDYLTFSSLLKKRFYYSRSLRRYFAKHPQAKQQEFRFIRVAFLKRWKVLAADPFHF
ncbi:MAG: glycosyltransferase, partial [Nanoarchaeota archaeon]